MKTPISVLLSNKRNSKLYTTTSDSTVFEAVNSMNMHHIGSILVVDNDKLVGIFTERDALRRVMAPNSNPHETLIKDVMSTSLTVASPDTLLLEAMELIQRSGHRHLPVIKDGELVGLISRGDITNCILNIYENEAGQLWSYITGDSPEAVSEHM